MKIHNSFRWLLVAIVISNPFCLLAQTSTEPGTTGAKVWGDAVNDLQMSLYFDPKQTGTIPRLRVGLRNVGTSDITVMLGQDCGFVPNEPWFIELNLTEDQGKSLRLVYNAHTHNCDGAPTGWLEHLSPGTSFSIPISLDSFRYQLHGNWQTGWHQPGGTYLLEAVLLHQMTANRSIGSSFNVKSNQLQVHFPAE
jgi:hypothetical protein